MKRKIMYALVFAAFTAATAPAQTRRVVSIDELFSLIESGSKTLNASKTEAEVARQAVSEAKSRRLPDISTSLSVSYNGNVLMTDRDFSNAHGLTQPHLGNSFAIEAVQTVYSGGALSAGVEIAKLQHIQAETDVELSRTQQRFLALGLYLDLYKTANSITVYNSNIALTEQLIADIKAKRQQGMAIGNDVTRYELQMENLKLGLRKMKDRQAVINHQLCNTLGLDTGTVITADSSITAHITSRETEAEWQARATVSSPALRKSALGISIAEQQLRMAYSDKRPRLTVYAADKFSGPFTYDIPPIDKNFNIWSIGISLKYSISSLFKANKTVRKARAMVAQSRDSHAVAAEQLDNQMQQAYKLYLQAFTELHTQQKNVELAAQNYKVISERYLAQIALITDMIDASNIKLNAELLEADAQANIVYAYYRMKFIAGEI